MESVRDETTAIRVILGVIPIDERNQIQIAANPFGGWHLEIWRWWRYGPDDPWKPGRSGSGFSFRDEQQQLLSKCLVEYWKLEKVPVAKPEAMDTNPRSLGTNPRSLGTNPRAKGTNPKARRSGSDHQYAKGLVAHYSQRPTGNAEALRILQSPQQEETA